MGDYKAKFISGDPEYGPNDFQITFELYRNGVLLNKYVDALQGSGFVPTYTYKKATKEIYIRAQDYFYDGFNSWGREGTKYNIPANDIDKYEFINIEGYVFPESSTEPSATSTGDIKIFIDAFNKDFDVEIKQLVDAQQNYKNVYADAIKITTPKEGPWPNDPKVVTIGDLFKYVFPDIESDKIVKPPSNNLLYDEKERENYKGWSRDLENSNDEKIKKMYYTILKGLRSNSKLQDFQELKKPGITNPSLWSPGQYYFDVFMSRMLSSYGPLKDPTDANAGSGAFGADLLGGSSWEKGWLEANGGSASVSNFTKDGEANIGSFDYSHFHEILTRGYVGSGIKYQMENLTGINIGFYEDPSTKLPTSFPSLFTQYRNGPLSEFISIENSKIIYKDPKFNIFIGAIIDPLDKEIEINTQKEIFELRALTDLTGYKFVGYYLHMLLYKAFVQAGDNYKSVVLPLRNPEPEPVYEPVTVLAKVVEPTAVGEVQFKFNVEKKDTFIVVGGTVSPPLELIIVPNDGTTYIIETPDVSNNDDLGDEYMEGDFTGSDEVNIEYDEIITSIDNFDYQKAATITVDNNTTNASTDTQTDTPTNFSPGEEEKHLYEFIQKRVKKGYKYSGTPVYNVSQADISKLASITKKYGIPLEWLANLINHESAGTFNPAIKNSIGASGLIQFMTTINKKPMTYTKANGSDSVNTATLRQMTFSNQLDYVDGFIYKVVRNKLTNGKVKKDFTQTDMFMTIFTPAAVGKPNYTFSAGTQKANGGITHPIDYTKKALAGSKAPFPLVPDDLVKYVAKFGNGKIQNSNVA
jgi:hypothetical protein